MSLDLIELKAQVLGRIEDLEARAREREELLFELIPAMEIRGHDPAPIREMNRWLGFRQWTAGSPDRSTNPQEGCFPCWRYPDHTRRKSPG
jgi:hypothetical protein